MKPHILFELTAGRGTRLLFELPYTARPVYTVLSSSTCSTSAVTSTLIQALIEILIPF